MAEQGGLMSIPPFNAQGHLNVVVETPRGSRIKYKFDEETGLFKVHKVMPTGTVFPFDFGFLPSTQGPDGDPLDVLTLIDEPVTVGCLVEVRLLGVIEAKQTQDGKTTRNDRILGVALASRIHQEIRSIRDLGSKLLDEIEAFFVSYNDLQDRKFKPLGRRDASLAKRLIKTGMQQFESHHVG